MLEVIAHFIDALVLVAVGADAMAGHADFAILALLFFQRFDLVFELNDGLALLLVEVLQGLELAF